MVDKVLFSHNVTEWGTPKELYERLNQEFHFDLDPCTTADNPLKTDVFYTKEDDGLTKQWKGSSIYINPPYNQEIGKWLEKANYEFRNNSKIKTIVLLLPARTDTKWFFKYIYDLDTNKYRPNVNVRFIKGRLKFSNSKNSAPFPSILVIFSRK